MSDAAKAIEVFFAKRYEREAIYLPSGRLALFLAFREWLRPGDRLLMSPVNDDVVFFTVLAAGLVPVIGPLDPRTGNLDPEGLDEATCRSLDAVMTTNLYGIPDRMDRWVDLSARFEWLLIEDACQALDTRWQGRRVGSFSAVAAFSLTKHIEGAGGVLIFQDPKRRESLLEAAAAAIRVPSLLESGRRDLRRRLRRAAEATGALAALQGARHAVSPRVHERQGHRMPYQETEVLQAIQAGAGLDRFDRWVRVDKASYRRQVSSGEIRATLAQLQDFESSRRLRLEGARILRGLGLTPADVPLPQDDALFKIPLFVHDREGVLQRLQKQGLSVDYIYDPPLERFATPAMAPSLPSPGVAIRWSRDVLPISPLQAERLVKLLDSTALRPATDASIAS